MIVLWLGAVLAFAGCAGTAEPADEAEIAELSVPAGVAPELVYVLDGEDLVLAGQSVGVSGDDGLSAAYVRESDAATVLLRTERDASDPSLAACADLPDAGPPRCVVERGDVRVVLEGDGVDVATLRTAAGTVRVPDASTLRALFADVPAAPDAPTERGDLPPGDGAPVDPPAAGG
ncbi:hypothetical protein KIN34_05780 [Cellulomonas sp. DKR-3]|uniref:Lipoprotein n=1 Tax=Cellulomonas fulva TaxID=2835530 RepID=A0ABS5TXB2_9CELL|nr:hypothetical protein [Cellulomonas fulva]MBT0993794.1 hypothetical protein [Cellulomonas fulva]